MGSHEHQPWRDWDDDALWPDEEQKLPIGRWFLYLMAGVCALCAVSLLSGCALSRGSAGDELGIQSLLSELRADLSKVREPSRLKAAVQYLCHDRIMYLKIPGQWCADAETAVGLHEILFGNTPLPVVP